MEICPCTDEYGAHNVMETDPSDNGVVSLIAEAYPAGISLFNMLAVKFMTLLINDRSGMIALKRQTS